MNVLLYRLKMLGECHRELGVGLLYRLIFRIFIFFDFFGTEAKYRTGRTFLFTIHGSFTQDGWDGVRVYNGIITPIHP